MFIKSIVLDGFKSYGNRVEITGFDPAFNAITGLNGTGKSNILDSICFVLGITNLSNVRAGSLQELIYKHGQAGITKATVSITFDNRDKNQAPVGYENSDEITITRQIVMGGKNKYLINGINVQNKRVSDLFCSVQLNVNNPHFLIMQGRITKVLNMKPPEILSMIEEAAGTSMYESKKLQAQNTIAKKDAKLAELEDIINEDIAPKLQKLQDERVQYQEHQQVVREIDGITKLHKAYQYVQAEKKCLEYEENIKKVIDEMQASEELIKDNEKECKAIDKDIAEMHKKLDQESSGVLAAIDAELSEVERSEARTAAAQRAAADAEREHAARDQRLQRALRDDEAALAVKQAAADKAVASFAGLKEASDSSAAALEAAQARFLAVSEGREGGADSLHDQLMAAKQQSVEAGTRLAAAAMALDAHSARLTRLRKDAERGAQAYERDQRDIRQKEAQLDELQKSLDELSFDEAAYVSLQGAARAAEGAARARRDAVDALAVRLQRTDFVYSPPTSNFDKTKVHGTIARLVQVRDPQYCTALETIAGGRLYNVVVDTEETSKLLIQRGNLQQRTTIIPLNKISGQVIDRNTVQFAQSLGGGPNGVQLALDLVSGADVVQPALRYVFGSTLVCRDLETAKRVCFHPRVRRRAVTLDGDLLDPAGTLSGGAKLKSASILMQLAELAEKTAELASATAAASAAAAALAAATAAAERHGPARRRAELLRHELDVLRARLAATEHAHTHQEIQALDDQVREMKEARVRDEALQREGTARAVALEAQVQDIEGHREREFVRAETELKRAKAAAAKHGAAWSARDEQLEALRLDVQALRAAVETSRAHLADTAAAAAELRAASEAAQQEADAAAAAAKELHARRDRARAELAQRERGLRERAARAEALRQAARDAALQRRERDLALQDLRREEQAARDKLARLTADSPWLEAERAFFGAAGGAYDFAARDAAGAAARLARLQARREQLARGLNARAHTLHTKEEEQFAELLRKKRIVEGDRAKLVETLRELDETKRATLLTACEKVNRDFGAIFGALLPGAAARLTPPPGRGVLDGLEVRVGFNGAWKESLGELSGGQRSLVALALVLAMLLFKPAPLYILDEVDAALDLSHTQNIGVMLRDHFRHSQFLIVSLKDGMFNNANVLFRTRFQDGMSSVTRTVNDQRQRAARQ